MTSRLSSIGTGMSTWIALLRGIGGNIRTLPMQAFRDELARLGLCSVRTYIQTGNAVFESARTSSAGLAQLIERCVSERFGFETRVVMLRLPELRKVVRDNPFKQAQARPTSLHVFFLSQTAHAPDLAAMQALKDTSEQFVLKRNVLYLYAPKGFGISRLAGRVERLLGVPATARNWRTVLALLALAESDANRPTATARRSAGV